MRDDTAGPEPSDAKPFDMSTLVDGLAPVRPLQLRHGMILALLATLVAAVTVALTMGVREDVAIGNPHRMFVVRAIVLVGLGVIAAAAALSTASPAVGKPRLTAWKWALAGAALVPLGAAYVWLSGPVQTMAHARAMLDPQFGLECLVVSSLCAVGVGAALTLWIRQGAPSSPERAGWLIGLASGALGAAAYSLHCSENVLIYIGTWYTLAVAGCALAGRMILPRLLRW